MNFGISVMPLPEDFMKPPSIYRRDKFICPTARECTVSF